jgi:thioredoxin 1
MSSSQIIHITPANWKAEVIESATPVLVDFWAEWCGPCKAIAPILEELSGELTGQMKIVKVDIDTNRDIATQFSIRSIPTLLIFKAGEVKGQIVGSMGKAQLKERLSAHL